MERSMDTDWTTIDVNELSIRMAGDMAHESGGTTFIPCEALDPAGNLIYTHMVARASAFIRDLKTRPDWKAMLFHICEKETRRALTEKKRAATLSIGDKVELMLFEPPPV
jgi:hypothetical protein